MNKIPQYFDGELPPRIYGKSVLPSSADDVPPPIIRSIDVHEREIGLSTRAAIAVFVLVIGGVYLAINGATLLKCIDENIVCEFE